MSEERAPGIVETLTTGFGIVTKRWWLILPPIVLDLYYWLGPSLSITPLLRRISSTLTLPFDTLADYGEVAGQLGAVLEEAANATDLSTLLSSRILGVPALITGETPALPLSFHPATIEISSPWVFLSAFIALSLVGLLAACFYLGMVAQEVRDSHIDIVYLLRRIPYLWLRLILASLVIILGGTLVLLPASIMISVASLFGQGVTSLMQSLLVASVLWIGIYLYFVPRAILLGDETVLRSFSTSIQLVRSSFWATLGLIILVFIIDNGLYLVWQLLLVNPWGTLVAIIGNAFVGTGLAAATLVFYRDRYAVWLQMLEQRKAGTP